MPSPFWSFNSTVDPSGLSNGTVIRYNEQKCFTQKCFTASQRREQDSTGICQAVATLLAGGRFIAVFFDFTRVLAAVACQTLTRWKSDQCLAAPSCGIPDVHIDGFSWCAGRICLKLHCRLQWCSRSLESRYPAGLGTLLGCHLVAGPSICSS